MRASRGRKWENKMYKLKRSIAYRRLKKSRLQRGLNPMRRSNQLSYEATDVGSWSFVSSNEPVKNGCEVIY